MEFVGPLVASLDFSALPQQLVNGILTGAIYALIALGYTMVYGVIRLINFAHGEVFMLGAYAALFVSLSMGFSQTALQTHDLASSPANLLIMMLTAMAVCAVVGVLIEMLAYRPIRNQPRIVALITAIGVSLLIQNAGTLFLPSDPPPSIQEQINPYRGAIETPAGSWISLHVPIGQLIMLVVSIVLMVLLRQLVMKTKVGRAMRAVSHDFSTASLMGIDVNRTVMLTFLIGSSLAGAGAMMNATFLGTPLTPYYGVQAGIKAFVAAVLGGIGNIPGAVLGGLLMGMAETIVIWLNYSNYKDAVAFVILIVVLLFRPGGLLGSAATEKV